MLPASPGTCIASLQAAHRLPHLSNAAAVTQVQYHTVTASWHDGVVANLRTLQRLHRRDDEWTFHLRPCNVHVMHSS